MENNEQIEQQIIKKFLILRQIKGINKKSLNNEEIDILNKSILDSSQIIKSGILISSDNYIENINNFINDLIKSNEEQGLKKIILFTDNLINNNYLYEVDLLIEEFISKNNFPNIYYITLLRNSFRAKKYLKNYEILYNKTYSLLENPNVLLSDLK